ncbi:hypothetical protein FHR83_001912 [Actinoplanes campanulatus]|uniref:Uncharacterized protein n=1 Tax=Actinoplanes campanulatus TaxID=113559 RepID=A0A7W5ADX2_9ACTN|nr:hypothetical protein [Actinoplanes campanulatus]MBB3094260.1 hypothetical protein [Actinoplanes campanulatus]GGN19716.1 hypothetical protein GCM10010109_33290 [Actinoplanes campanulatus]GID35820.1 hypothetical protein Aca09nite_23260 [Actinoplanes campanulatus]
MSERSWEVDPGSGVGPLRFGTPRAELQALLGQHRAFRRSPTSDLADQYETGTIMLTCSDDQGLHLIEIPDPDGVYYRGVHLNGAVTTVLNDLRVAGIEVTADDSGWLLADGAIALYTPSSEPGAHIEAVTAFGPGHEMRGEIVFFPAGVDATPANSSYLVTPGTGIGPIMLGQHRDEVRRQLNGGVCWQHAAGSREPVEDNFFEDHLVVRYGPSLLADRIFVTRADAVLLDAINLMPAYPQTIEDVRPLLTQAGHRLIEQEAGIEIADAGIQILTMRPSPSSDGPLPVACVAISARNAPPQL